MIKKEFAEADSDYLKINPTWHIEDSPWKATQIIRMIQEQKLAPKTVVEIGCGAGEILNQLHDRLEDKSIQYSGYEIAPDAYNFSLSRQKERLQFYHEDLLAKDVHFDLLLMIDVFEHVEDYFGFIKAAAKKADYKIYHIPLDISAYAAVINNYKYIRTPGGHIHYYSKDTALATLRETGQEVIGWFYTKSSTELYKNKGSLFTRCMNLVRRVLFKIKPDLCVRLMGGYSLLVLTK